MQGGEERYSQEDERGYGRDWPRDDHDFSDYGSGYGRGYDREWNGDHERHQPSHEYSRSWSGSRDYGGDRSQRGYRGREDRGFFDKAADEVSSWFGDEDAERRRHADRMYEGHGPKNYTRSDERIREDVSDRLTDDNYVDAREIEVDVKNAEVTLTGTVQDRAQRHRAEYCAEVVSGVKHVQNNLRVSDLAQTGSPLGTGTGVMSNRTGSGLRTGKAGT
jgi:osmotically-inducible protein OsmY